MNLQPKSLDSVEMIAVTESVCYGKQFYGMAEEPRKSCDSGERLCCVTANPMLTPVMIPNDARVTHANAESSRTNTKATANLLRCDVWNRMCERCGGYT